MSETCHRSGQKVYAADRPVRIGGMVFHPGHFTCKATGVKVSLKTATVATDPATGEKDVYLRGKEPWVKPNQVDDVITHRVLAVPDANMRTTDRKFNVAGKQANRGATGEDAGSNYGDGSVVVDTQTKVPKPPPTVNNINLFGVQYPRTISAHRLAARSYTNATGEASAE